MRHLSECVPWTLTGSEYWFPWLFLVLINPAATAIDLVSLCGDIDHLLANVGVDLNTGYIIRANGLLVRRLHDTCSGARWAPICLVPNAAKIVF